MIGSHYNMVNMTSEDNSLGFQKAEVHHCAHLV